MASADIDTPDLDARLLVEHFTGTSRGDAISSPGREIEPDTLAAVEAAIARRLAGEPVHRILGHREFYGLKLRLLAGTLEPRPDTETLVDAALPHVQAFVKREGQCRILDLGTGTGAVALALLAQAPQATAIGADVSTDALETAAGNARDLGLADRFRAVESDWFSNISDRYDVIVSNPPYIRRDEIQSLPANVRDFDPLAALDGGADGLDAYRKIASGCALHMSADAVLAVEIGYDQRNDVAKLFRESGYVIESFHRDLGGNDRVIVAKKAE